MAIVCAEERSRGNPTVIGADRLTYLRRVGVSLKPIHGGVEA